MKKKQLLLIPFLCLLLLSSCSPSSSKSQSESFSDCQKGFMGISGNKIYPSSDGYYFFAGHYLMFADRHLKETTFVCNKPECLHAEEAPENRINCNAFFLEPRSLICENNSLYVLGRNLQIKEYDAYSIYKTDIDGNNRSNIYTAKEQMDAFLLHQGNIYTSELNFTDDNGKLLDNPIVSIHKISLANTKKEDIIFQDDTLNEGRINRLNCYNNYCYFDLIDFSETMTTESKKINLETLEISNSFPFDTASTILGKNCIFCEESIENDLTNHTWKSRYWQLDVNGKKPVELTKEFFSVIEKNAIMLTADDKYVYFHDIDYGANAVAKEERLFYVYTYDGTLVCGIPFGEIQNYIDYYAGDNRYLFIYEKVPVENDDSKIIYRYLDKTKFGKDARFEVLFEGYQSQYYGTTIY